MASVLLENQNGKKGSFVGETQNKTPMSWYFMQNNHIHSLELKSQCLMLKKFCL